MYDFITTESPHSKYYHSLQRSIDHKLELIRFNPNAGHPISKKLIPKTYVENDNITNLFHVALAHYWRMVYSTGKIPGDSNIRVIIIEIIDHPTYDKRFGYQRK
jgi:hypothetical protein